MIWEDKHSLSRWLTLASLTNHTTGLLFSTCCSGKEPVFLPRTFFRYKLPEYSTCNIWKNCRQSKINRDQSPKCTICSMTWEDKHCLSRWLTLANHTTGGCGFFFLFLFTYLFNFVFCVVDRVGQTDWVSQTGIFSRSFDLRFIPRKVHDQVPSFLGKAVGWGLIADNSQTENLTPEWKITDHGYRYFIFPYHENKQAGNVLFNNLLLR